VINVRSVASLDDAFVCLMDSLRVPTGDPFTPHLVITQTRGIELWLSQRLSTVLGTSDGGSDGVVANVMFARPDFLLSGTTSNGVARRQVWRHLRAIDTDVPLQRVSDITDRLNAYCQFRPEMVAGWVGGELPVDGVARWQAELLRASMRPLVAQGNSVTDESWAGITVLLTKPLAPMLAQRCVDISNGTDLSVVAVLGWPSEESIEANPLVATWGATSAGGWRRLAEVLDSDLSAAVPPSRGDSLLSRAQAAVRRNLPVAVGARDEPDGSVAVHSCHSDARQVEVLRDAIAHALNDDALGLELHDVVIVCPSVERFRPLLNSVVVPLPADEAVAEQSSPRWPLAFMSRDLGDFASMAALVRLLEVADARCSASEIEELLSDSVVAEAFGFTDDDRRSFPAWVSASAVRWGLDAAHLAEAQMPADAECWTWRAALDRLLLGVAMDSTYTRLGVGGRPPAHGISFDDAPGIGRLSSLIELLSSLRTLVRQPKPVPVWIELVREVTGKLLPADRSDDWRYTNRVLRRITNEFQSEDDDGADLMVGVHDVLDLLREASSSVGRSEQIEGGRIAVCGPEELRGVPFRMVCILGFDSDALYESFRDPSDLLATAPRDGDPNASGEQRGALLDAVLSAVDRLVITYTGQNVQTNEVVAPCTALVELMEMLQEPPHDASTAWLPAFVVQHPRHAYSPTNFTPDGLVTGRWSFDPAALDAASASAAASPAPMRLVHGPVPEPSPDRVIQVADLVKALANTSRHFLWHTFGIRVPSSGDVHPDLLTTDMNSLEAWQAAQQLFAAAGEFEEEVFQLVPNWGRRARGDGLLPVGQFGERASREAQARVAALQTALSQRALPLTADGCRRVNVSLASGRLVGAVGDLHASTVLLARPAKFKAAAYLDACVRRLALSAAGQPVGVVVAALESLKSETPTVVTAELDDQLEPETAVTALNNLVATMDLCAHRAVPLPVATSAAWAGRTKSPWSPASAAFNADARDPSFAYLFGGCSLKDLASWQLEPTSDRMQSMANKLWMNLEGRPRWV